jgi:signal transduction histidine kinase
MRGSGVRVLLLVHLAALAAGISALLLALGLPLLARGRLHAPQLVALVAAAALLLVAAGAALLFRAVARPVDRLLAAAERLGSAAPRISLPVLGEPGGSALSRGAVAFERLALALDEERGHLAAKVDELTRANRALAEARESLLRSEKLATVGRLASGVAHEVGNPLGAVSGYVELCRSRIAQGALGEADDYLRRIGVEAARIDRTVRELLAFARPSSPALAPIDLGAPLDAALRLARVQERFRGVEAEVDVPAGLPPVLADEHHLAQVFLNLLLNAGDAMGGRGRVRIAATADGPGGAAGDLRRVRVTLADEGPGIAADDLGRIFDPFFTTKAPGEGTGLGLAICHSLMESFGGEITAAAGAGGGAVFTLLLRTG